MSLFGLMTVGDDKVPDIFQGTSGKCGCSTTLKYIFDHISRLISNFVINDEKTCLLSMVDNQEFTKVHIKRQNDLLK